MFSREIICAACHHKGTVEIGTSYATPVSTIFKYIGHDPHGGDLYFRCPSCGAQLAADPMKLLNAKSTLGSYIPDDPVIHMPRNHTSSPSIRWIVFTGAFLFLILLRILIYLLQGV